jgi:hypothetical protein
MRYKVRVEHEVVEYAVIEVEASSEDEALEKAYDAVDNLDWELDNYMGDNSFSILGENRERIDG